MGGHDDWILPVGQTVEGRFELLELVGRGPNGVVYRARDRALGSEVAFKLLHPALAAPANRETNLFRIYRARAFVHENLVPVSDVLDRPGAISVISPFVHAPSLRRFVEARRAGVRPLTRAEVATLVVQTCRALQRVHLLGPHANLKPENIFVAGDEVRVADPFLLLGRGDVPTEHGTFRLRDHYVAPELLRDARDERRESDIYALGLIVGELIVGAPVRPGVPLSDQGPLFSDPLDRVFLAATASEPSARPNTVSSFWNALRETIGASSIELDGRSIAGVLQQAPGFEPAAADPPPRPSAATPHRVQAAGVTAADPFESPTVERSAVTLEELDELDALERSFRAEERRAVDGDDLEFAAPLPDDGPFDLREAAVVLGDADAFLRSVQEDFDDADVDLDDTDEPTIEVPAMDPDEAFDFDFEFEERPVERVPELEALTGESQEPAEIPVPPRPPDEALAEELDAPVAFEEIEGLEEIEEIGDLDDFDALDGAGEPLALPDADLVEDDGVSSFHERATTSVRVDDLAFHARETMAVEVIPEESRGDFRERATVAIERYDPEGGDGSVPSVESAVAGTASSDRLVVERYEPAAAAPPGGRPVTEELEAVDEVLVGGPEVVAELLVEVSVGDDVPRTRGASLPPALKTTAEIDVSELEELDLGESEEAGVEPAVAIPASGAPPLPPSSSDRGVEPRAAAAPVPVPATQAAPSASEAADAFETEPVTDEPGARPEGADLDPLSAFMAEVGAEAEIDHSDEAERSGLIRFDDDEARRREKEAVAAAKAATAAAKAAAVRTLAEAAARDAAATNDSATAKFTPRPRSAAAASAKAPPRAGEPGKGGVPPWAVAALILVIVGAGVVFVLWLTGDRGGAKSGVPSSGPAGASGAASAVPDAVARRAAPLDVVTAPPDVPAIAPDVPAVAPDVPAVALDVPAVAPDVPVVAPDVPAAGPAVALDVEPAEPAVVLDAGGGMVVAIAPGGPDDGPDAAAEGEDDEGADAGGGEEGADEPDAGAAAAFEPTLRLAQLRCPGGMARVKVRASKRDWEEGKVAKGGVWAYCIDRYEFPGSSGATPKTGVTWYTARQLCDARDKRLCTSREWRRACGGVFPYGSTYDPLACNTMREDGTGRPVKPTGSSPRCKSGAGVYDMSGNVAEWTANKAVAGGSANRDGETARCNRLPRRFESSSSPYVGFRCCADPEAK